MKGKLWELGPFALAILIGLYVLATRLVQAPAAPGPRAGMPPGATSGAGDPTKPQDFLADEHSERDPLAKPDPHTKPDPVTR